jgi:hypothetical protein
MSVRPDNNATSRARRVLAPVFLISWLSQVFYLVPVPDLTKWGSTDPIEATRIVGWLISAALVSFGLTAGLVTIVRKRGLVLIFASSISYVAVWWLFSGYFDVEMSLAKLFSDLWLAAKASARPFVFLHLDVVLLAYYHIMIVVLAYLMYRDKVARPDG